MKNFNHYAGREEFSAFKDFFLTHGQCKEMKKKEYFTLQGALATHGAYIEEGLFVGYSFAGEYVGDYPACLKKEKAMVSIQAASDARIYYASAEDMRNFFSTNEMTQNLERILAEELFVQTYMRLLDIYCKTPTELYLDLVKRYPDFQNFITLKEVASFLRVTPETVSHIRKKFE